MHVILEIDGEPHEVWLVRTEDRVKVEVGGTTYDATVSRAPDGRLEVRLAGQAHRVEVLGTARARVDGRALEFHVPFFAPGGAPGQHEEATAGAARVKPPMPGRVVAVKVREGQKVKRGDVLLVLESMKMQNEVASPVDGTVQKVHVKAGQTVEAKVVMVELEP